MAWHQTLMNDDYPAAIVVASTQNSRNVERSLRSASHGDGSLNEGVTLGVTQSLTHPHTHIYAHTQRNERGDDARDNAVRSRDFLTASQSSNVDVTGRGPAISGLTSSSVVSSPVSSDQSCSESPNVYDSQGSHRLNPTASVRRRAHELQQAANSHPPSDHLENNKDYPESSFRLILRHYFFGQIASVAKTALWWSTFGVLLTTIVDNPMAVGFGRIAFNVGLLIASPIANTIPRHCPSIRAIKRVLLTTTLGRLALWAIVMPILSFAYLTLVIDHESKTSITPNTSPSSDAPQSNAYEPYILTALFVSLLADGVCVACANTVDIDCGGVEAIGDACRTRVSDHTRYRFTSLHQLVFDATFILASPFFILIAMLSTRASAASDSHGGKVEWISDRLLGSSLPLTLFVATSFVATSVLSSCFYSRLPSQPKIKHTQHKPDPRHSNRDHFNIDHYAFKSCSESDAYEEGRGRSGPRDFYAPLHSPTVHGRPSSSGQRSKSPSRKALIAAEYLRKLEEITFGWTLCVNNHQLRYRLMILAMETALEDAMVSVILPMLSFQILAALSTRGTTSAFNPPNALGITGMQEVNAGHLMDPLFVAACAATLIGIGKLGGITASFYLARDLAASAQSPLPHSHTETQSHIGDDERMYEGDTAGRRRAEMGTAGPNATGPMHLLQDSRQLSRLVFVSALPVFLIPIGLSLLQYSDDELQVGILRAKMMGKGEAGDVAVSVRQVAGLGLIGTAIFGSFFFAAAPKIGFANKLQESTARLGEREAQAVFAFIGILVTLTDGLVILLLNLLFVYITEQFSPIMGFTAVALVLLFHGFLEIHNS